MPRTIHVTVTYSVHIEDDKMSDRQARIHAKENFEVEGSVFDVTTKIFEKWKAVSVKYRRGIGSYWNTWQTVRDILSVILTQLKTFIVWQMN
jgi:hypothetical protein